MGPSSNYSMSLHTIRTEQDIALKSARHAAYSTIPCQLPCIYEPRSSNIPIACHVFVAKENGGFKSYWARAGGTNYSIYGENGCLNANNV